MSPAQTEAMAEQARKRLADFINRVAGQQLRRMREHWNKAAA